MQTTTLPPSRRKRRGSWGRMLWLLFFMGLLILGGVAYLWYQENYGPVDTRITPDYGAEKPIFHQGKLLEGGAVGEGHTLKLPLPLLQETVDPAIHYEESSKSIIITTEHHVVRLVTDQLSGWVNDQPVELRFPVESIDDIIYVPIEPLTRFYGISLEETDSGVVILRKPGDIISRVEVPLPHVLPEDRRSDRRHEAGAVEAVVDEPRTGPLVRLPGL